MWCTLTLGLLTILAGLNGFQCMLESALVTELLQGYNNNVIPTTSADPVVKVEHSVTVLRILSFEHEYLELEAWTVMMWTDSRLKWNPANYNNITSTNVFYEQLWIPDIVSWNFKNEEKMINGLRAVIHHTGLVTFVPPVRVVAYCTVSTGAEEIHTCTIKFGSWTYSGIKLDLQNTAGIVDMSDYAENEDWVISNSTVVRNVALYTCCPEPYPNLAYTLQLKPKHHRNHCK